MKEHPILFSGQMVRALLADRKFVTRRMSKQWLKVKSGDRLCVRETFYCDDYRFDSGVVADIPELRASLMYRADGEFRDVLEDHMEARWRPSIHMPRWASRILLKCEEDARVERLWDITEEEAIAEGVELSMRCGGLMCRPGFRDLWGTLHTKPGERWEDNPEVVRVGRFRRIASAGGTVRP